MQLSNPGTGADGTKSFVATFNVLIYQGAVCDYVSGQTTDEDGNPVNTTAQPTFFDDIFEINGFTSIFKTVAPTNFQSISIKRIKLINHFYNQIQYGVSAVQTSVVSDTLDTNDPDDPRISRITYLSEPLDTLNNIISVSGTITPNTQSISSSIGSVISNQTYLLPSPFYFSTTQFTDDSDVINGLKIMSTDNSVPTRTLVGLTKDEDDSLVALTATNELQNTRLYLTPIFDGSKDYASVENISFIKYNVGIVGEDSNGQLTLLTPDNSINIYSLDQRCYYSQGYSEYLPQDNSHLGLILNLDVSL